MEKGTNDQDTISRQRLLFFIARTYVYEQRTNEGGGRDAGGNVCQENSTKWIREISVFMGLGFNFFLIIVVLCRCVIIATRL